MAVPRGMPSRLEYRLRVPFIRLQDFLGFMTSDDPEAQKKVRPVPVHMWQGWEPNPGADVAGVGQSRRRCGQRCAVSFRPSRCGQVPGQMWAGFEYPEGFVYPINDTEKF